MTHWNRRRSGNGEDAIDAWSTRIDRQVQRESFVVIMEIRATWIDDVAIHVDLRQTRGGDFVARQTSRFN